MTAAETPHWLSAVERPTLILDERRARANIARMAAKARGADVRFRPHFKTHQSAAVGAWFRETGVRCATVSSLDMAAYFADHGWDDLLVAFPANPRQIGLINQLAARIALGLLVESQETVNFLAANVAHPLTIWIEVDTGYGRTGLAWDRPDAIAALARSVQAAPNLRLAGLLVHAGHSYKARGSDAIMAVYAESMARSDALRERLSGEGLGGLKVTFGDTPCCSLADHFPGVDELRPGNFVFYDLTQLAIGSCREEDIALAVACPVVARYPERDTVVVHGGAVHLSKDSLDLPGGARCFGRVALPAEGGWGRLIDDALVASVSQEHGMIRAPRALVESLAVGDVLMIIPVHACLTADLLRCYATPGGATLEMAQVRVLKPLT